MLLCGHAREGHKNVIDRERSSPLSVTILAAEREGGGILPAPGPRCLQLPGQLPPMPVAVAHLRIILTGVLFPFAVTVENADMGRLTGLRDHLDL